MKKLFFFRSSSNSASNNPVPPTSTDKQVYWENPTESRLRTDARKGDEYNSQSFTSSVFKAESAKSVNDRLEANSSGLRRSRSFSSAAFHGNRLGQTNVCSSSEQSDSPSSSSSGAQAQRCRHPSRRRALTPDRLVKSKKCRALSIDGEERIPFSNSSKFYHDSSESSSISSSNVSGNVLDLYIDGEQGQERSRSKKSTTQRDNTGVKRPPRIQRTAPASPTGSKARCQLFRGSQGTQCYLSPRDWMENGFDHDSPLSLAKHIAENLSLTHVPTSCKENDPITIADVYGGSLNKSPGFKSCGMDGKGLFMEGSYESNNGYCIKDYSDFGRNDGCSLLSTENYDVLEKELRDKYKEAEERILFLSEELEAEQFPCDTEYDVPTLVEKIKTLIEDKIGLALEVSTSLKNRISERAHMKEELRSTTLALESVTRKFEKEKGELQSALEKELDRRSSEWSFKLEKVQVEEQRLRQRVRELAEQNVSLQRELSSFNERETEWKNSIASFDKQIEELNAMLEVARAENQGHRENIRELQEKYEAAEDDRRCIRKIFEEKEVECKELHKSITRLLKTCNEQEKTIDGLQTELGAVVQKKLPLETSDNHVQSLQMEQIRLTRVEQVLRREVESYKLDADSLRQENINLLNRLKSCGREGGSLTFKLDQELLARLHCLQNQSLTLINESSNLCSKLLEFIKGRTDQAIGMNDGLKVSRNALDGQFLVECDMKIQGFRRGAESLMRSLLSASSVMHEKSRFIPFHCGTLSGEGDGFDQNEQNSQDLTRYELKAEILLTSLLREKLYNKDLEVEQLQADLATAARGTDILRCEVQNAVDALSCATHKIKDLELQMIEKDKKSNQLQHELQECTKELTINRGTLPKVTKERDLMWEEIKRYREENMLLNSEVTMLKKKMDALDEDILLKEGQITILKDSLGKKPFDLLSSPDRTQEFLLE